MKAFRELERILAAVKDTESMDAAKGRVFACYERFDEVVARGRKLPQPPPADVNEQLKAETAELQQALRAVDQQRRRISALPGGAEFFKSFER